MTEKEETLQQNQDAVKQDGNRQQPTTPSGSFNDDDINNKSTNHDSNPQGGNSDNNASGHSRTSDSPTGGAPVAGSERVGHNKFKVPPYVKDSRKLFVGGLDSNVTREEFRNFFEEYGVVLDSVVMVDRDTGRSRGFGFVTFEDPQVAMNLLLTSCDDGEDSKKPEGGQELISRVTIHGKVCEIKAAQPRNEMANVAGPKWKGGRGSNRGGVHPRHSKNYNQTGQFGQARIGYVEPIVFPNESVVFPQFASQQNVGTEMMAGPWPMLPYPEGAAPNVYFQQQQGGSPMMFPAYVPGMYYSSGAPMGYQPETAAASTDDGTTSGPIPSYVIPAPPPANAEAFMPPPSVGAAVSPTFISDEQPPIAQPVSHATGYAFVPFVMGLPHAQTPQAAGPSQNLDESNTQKSKADEKK